MPRGDLDGKVNTLHADIAISARPNRKSDLRARYTYDDRDNETPRDIYVGVSNDTTDQGALVSARARVNLPYSRERHQVQLDAGYRILAKSKLSMGYDFDQIKRDFTEVDETREHTGRIK